MPTFFRSAFATALLSFAAASSHAGVITFEGSTPLGASRALDSDPANAFGPSLINYAGYDWSGMQVTQPLVSVGNPRQITGVTFEEDEGRLVPNYSTVAVDAGFDRSIVSGNTVAHTRSFSGSTFGSISARPGDSNFDFFSAYLTSGWLDNISVSVVGKRNGTAVYTRALTVGDDAPTLFTFNFFDIDSIEFLASGGTFLYGNGTTVGSYLNPGNSAFSTPVLVFDDLNMAATPVPEPETLAMVLAGLGIVGVVNRRRRSPTSVQGAQTHF